MADMSPEEADARRAAGAKAMNASWKMMSKEEDPTPKISYSQELMGYIPPAVCRQQRLVYTSYADCYFLFPFKPQS